MKVRLVDFVARISVTKEYVPVQDRYSSRLQEFSSSGWQTSVNQFAETAEQVLERACPMLALHTDRIAQERIELSEQLSRLYEKL